MKKKLISLLIANLFVAAPALRAGRFKVEGSVSLGGIYNDEDVVDAAKMNDIRDLSNGVLFGWDVKGRGNSYWFDFFGENIGRDDQYIEPEGRRVRDVQVPALFGLAHPQLAGERPHAVRRRGHQQPHRHRLAAAQHGHLERATRASTTAATTAATSSSAACRRGTSASTPTR